MNHVWKMVRALLSAMVLAALALPASAAPPVAKIYSLNVSPIGTSPIQVTIKNETPNGNSTINSFIISPPAGVTITGTPMASAPADVELRADGKVYVKAFDGLKAGTQTPKTLTISMTATYPSLPAPTCGTGFTWTAVAYTGNSFGQETFALNAGNPLTNPTQTVACNYSLTMTPSAAAAGATSALTAKFTNLSASASFNSVTLTVPPGSGWSITGASLPAGLTGTVSALPGGAVTISGITPAIAPSAFVNVALQVSVPCIASGGVWTSAVGGGFSLSGSNPSTTVGGACGLVILEQPEGAVSGVPFVVKVGAVDGNGNPITTFAGPVTLALNTISGSGTLAPGTSSATGGVVTFPAVTITGLGKFSLTASSAIGSASFNVTTSAFSVFAGGPLQCDPGFPFQFTGILPPGVTNINQPGYAAGQRGPFNKDGSECIAVGYTFTNNILGSNSATLQWDVTSQPGAAFSYTVTWKPEYVSASSGMPTRVTRLAWYDITGTTLGPVVPGRACLSPNLPAPYGTLVSGIDNAMTSIVINTVGGIAPLPTVPFPLVIGNERMTAVSGSAGSYTVVRGGSNGTTAAAHAGGARVMTTSLPLDAAGIQMRMCIAEEGWSAYPPGVNDCATTATPDPKIPAIPPTAPLACVLYTTTVHDVGDGFIIRD